MKVKRFPLTRHPRSTALAICPICGHFDWHKEGHLPMCIRLALHDGDGVTRMVPASLAQLEQATKDLEGVKA